MTTIGGVSWGSWPSIPLTFYYEKQRSGADMQYRFQIVIGQVWSMDGSQYFGYPIYCNILLDGTDVSGTLTLKGSAPSAWGGTISHTTGWYTVSGKAHGTTAVSFRMQGGDRDNYYSYALAVDPGASELSASGGTLGVEQVLSVVRYDSSFTHTITYVCGSQSGTVCTNSGETSVSFTPPMALASENTTGTTVAVTFTLQTYVTDTALGDPASVTVNMAIPDGVKPSAESGWVSAAPMNTGAVAGIACYVQGYSRALVTFDTDKVTMAYGADIAGCSVQLGTEAVTAVPYQTSVLTQAGEVALKCTLTDSRGRSVTESLTIPVQPYAKPVLTQVELYRCNSLGVAQDTGLYIGVQASASISSLDGENTRQLQVRYKTSVGDYGAYETITDGQLHVIGDGYISTANSYVAQLVLTDRLGNTAVYTKVIPTESVFFSGRAGGSGAGFGKHPEADDLLDVAWGLRVKQELEVEGGACVAGGLSVTGGVTAGAVSAEGDVTVGGALTAGDAKLAALTIGGKTLLDLCYPVGCIYQSAVSTSPAELFGGSWTQITDVFLLAAGGGYSGGATGGKTDYTLSACIGACNGNAKNVGYIPEEAAAYHTTSKLTYMVTCSSITSANITSINHSTPVTEKTSTGRDVTIIPPYLAVYMWQRTA